MAESQEPIRINLNKIASDEKDRCVAAWKNSHAFSLKSFLPVAEACHFERYTFAHPQGKLGVVYDTKAEMLTLTAKQGVLDAACREAQLCVSSAKPQSGSEESLDRKPDRKHEFAADNAVQSQAVTEQKGGSRQQSKSENKTPVKNKGANKKEKAEKTPAKIPAKASAKTPAPDTKGVEKTAGQETPEYKDGFAVKKCPQERLNGFITRIRGLKGVSVSSDAAQKKDVITYTVTDKVRHEKCLVRYAPKKQTLQLQGKHSNLFGEVQVILSSGSGFNEAMGGYTGEQKKTGSVQRSLKKLLPAAFDLLSEQSKIDLGIGMVDIGNDAVRLSDYSVLLVPPYRGLERFIFDLQQAYAISVKMIGQAYEKDERGNHCLKLAYRRKTGVVYSEVMSALYNEYFEKRNFYAHSDNTDSGFSRVIAEKATAKAIFDHLCEIIDYNAKKLKEIGFKPTGK